MLSLLLPSSAVEVSIGILLCEVGNEPVGRVAMGGIGTGYAATL